MGSQASVTQVPGIPTPSGVCRYCTHTQYTYIQAGKIYTHIVKKLHCEQEAVFPPLYNKWGLDSMLAAYVMGIGVTLRERSTPGRNQDPGSLPARPLQSLTCLRAQVMDDQGQKQMRERLRLNPRGRRQIQPKVPTNPPLAKKDSYPASQ